QAKHLTMELRCLIWGHVLLYIVYDFIRRFIREHGPPKFKIPEMRFVKAGLVFVQGQGKPDDLFLIEERICEKTEGKFRKYINNRAAIPSHFTDADDQESAEFLAFAQHFQYLRTFKMAFTSDYQGGKTLLTDPQIMSSPSAGTQLFADGNVKSGFQSFEADHKCTKFCTFFGLPTNYA
ncbi:MHCK/EF2 kinase, partial [Mycena latifolia]